MHDIHHLNLFVILATDPEAVVSLPERVTEHSAHIFFDCSNGSVYRHQFFNVSDRKFTL